MTCLPPRLIDAQLVDARVEAVPDGAAVACQGRGVVGERCLDRRAQVGEIVQFRDARLRTSGAWSSCRIIRSRGTAPSDCLERDQIPGTGRSERGPRNKPLEVLHRLERLPELPSLGRLEGEVLHRVEAIPHAFEREERPQEPGAQRPAAHRGDRPVDLVQEGPAPAALAGLHHLEVPQRDGIDHQRVGRLPEGGGAHVREVHLLRVAQVADQPAGRANGKRVRLEAEGVQAARPELLDQAGARRLDLETPGFDGRHGRAARRDRREVFCEAEVGRHDDLARAQDAHLVGQRLEADRAEVLGARELAGRQVDEGDADSLELNGNVRVGAGRRPGGLCRNRSVARQLRERRGRSAAAGWSCGPARQRKRGRERHQERRLAGVEIRGVGEGARRHHPHDLSAHQPLCLPRVLDLLADRHPEALLHEAREIPIHGVIGHAAHRDCTARRVLAARGQRQLQRARGDQRILEKGLVEVAHPEKDDGVPVLTLGLEVLPHGWRGLPEGSGGGRGFGWWRHEIDGKQSTRMPARLPARMVPTRCSFSRWIPRLVREASPWLATGN